ncbi:unnamed protein product, partial [marine sediment metagenome]
MSITTYAELQTAVANWLDRSDLTDRIVEFIELAEVDIHDELRVREMETRADITVDDEYIDVPTNFLSAKRLHLDTDPLWKIKFCSPDQINDFKRQGGGKPYYFTVIGSELEFDRTPDTSYTGKFVYYEKPVNLSVSATTNDVFPLYKNIYLYGALLQAEPFLGNDERLSTWAKMYDA